MATTYKIKKGDTLSGIAKQFGTTVEELAKSNNISNPNLIYAGNTLNIGGNEKPANTKPTTAPATTPTTKPANTKPATGTGGNSNAGAKANNNPAPSTNPTVTTAPAVEEYTAPELVLPDNYYTAQDILNQHQANRPGAYTPIWQDEADEWLGKYQNRDPFSYDFNSDALYQQYKDQYIQLGQLASEDVMGQAAAMTGGYGNSYAQSVGQQTYNQYLDKLNEVGLDLYDRAYNLYNQEGQDMLNMYNLYMNREAQERANYQAELSNWYDQYDLLKGDAESIYSKAWNEYTNSSTNSWNQYVHEDTKATNAKTNSFNNLVDLITNTGHIPTDDELKAAGMTRTQADSYGKAYGDSKASTEKSDLIKLITSTGYNPSDEELAAAGMTRKQANGYIDAYKKSVTTTSTSSGSGSSGNTKYTVLDYDEQAKWKKNFEKAEDIKDVDDIADDMAAAGVDPVLVASWRDRYAQKFKTKDSGTGVTGSGVAGGGGGGVNYWEAW